MELSPFNLNIILILCTLSNVSPGSARTLQIYNGTVTEITCSAAVPVFKLMRQGHGMEYGPLDYTQLPDLFDIEARPSPNGKNVTLFINGTNTSNNVTVVCRDFSNAGFGQIETLFTFELEFVSILPAPSDVRYSSRSLGQLQIMWEPPVLLNDELSSHVTIKSRITHYLLSITMDSDSVAMNYTSRTSFSIEFSNISCSLTFQVAAVNQVGKGKHSPSLTVDLCMDSTSSNEPASRADKLSAGGIAAITIVAVLITTSVMVLSAIIFVKFKNRKHTQTLNFKSGSIASNEIPAPHCSEDTLQNDKLTESGHYSSGDADRHVDKMQQSATTHCQTKYPQRGPLVYAEVVTKRQNQIAGPSSVEKMSYAVLEHPNQIINADS